MTTRSCPLCGHHEIGVTTEDGAFHPLKPGTYVKTLHSSPLEEPELKTIEAASSPLEGAEDPQKDSVPWVPQPLMNVRSCRLKYGVLVEENERLQVSGDLYKRAYLQKVRDLIEKEIATPVAVILDKYFTAPHLATGDPRQISLALWENLDEMQRPVDLVLDWMKHPDDEHTVRLMKSGIRKGEEEKPVSEDEFIRELKDLSLEAFLDVLTS